MNPALPLDVVRSPQRAATMLHPARLMLLGELREPQSASSLARKLDLPRQRLNYHLRALEKAGFVELVEERRKGNCTERVVRATARSYLISPEALGTLGPTVEAAQDRFSATDLMATAGRAVREIGELTGRAESEHKRLATLTLATDVRFASARHRAAFFEELADTIAQLVARYHDDQSPDGRPFRFFLGAYPSPAPPPTT